MRRTVYALATLAAAIATPAAAQNWPIPMAAMSGPGFGTTTVRCESINFTPTACPARTQGSVRMVQQLSRSCIRGQDWTYDQRTVWVRNGCRAIFLVGRDAGNGGGYPGPGGGGNGSAPVQNIDPQRHGYLATAQNLSAQAFGRITSAQSANNYNLGGHAERAKALLVQANNEMKLAALSANGN